MSQSPLNFYLNKNYYYRARRSTRNLSDGYEVYTSSMRGRDGKSVVVAKGFMDKMLAEILADYLNARCVALEEAQ